MRIPALLAPASIVLTVALSVSAFAAELYADVHDALDAGQADKALALLGKKADPYAENLRCRIYYSEERWDLAVQACEASVHASPNDSNYHLWLGRAYGEKADHASFITAYELAKRAAQEFEAAVRLDGKNLEALSDLGEFYAEAPAIVGGGRDKARGIAGRLQGLDAARYHMLMARIAEGDHDYATTEAELRAAIKTAPDPSERWIDLASFYRRHSRWPQMLEAVQQGQLTDTRHDAALLDAAQTLRRSGRHLDLAAILTRQYLSGGHLSEASPAFRAHWLLGELLDMRGDHAAALVEFNAADALAKNYKPSAK